MRKEHDIVTSGSGIFSRGRREREYEKKMATSIYDEDLDTLMTLQVSLETLPNLMVGLGHF